MPESGHSAALRRPALSVLRLGRQLRRCVHVVIHRHSLNRSTEEPRHAIEKPDDRKGKQEHRDDEKRDSEVCVMHFNVPPCARDEIHLEISLDRMITEQG